MKYVLQQSQQYLQRHGSPSARLDAEVLLSRVLGCSRVELYLRFDQPLSDEETTKAREWVVRRGKGEPVAYLVGEKEFFGRSFVVTSATLVPRPETEFLVESALELIPTGGECQVADLGCGSGCIGLTLACERPQAQILLVDSSVEALRIAKINSEKLGVVHRCEWLLGPVEEVLAYEGTLNLVVSNPPYIGSKDSDLSENVRKFEPSSALFAGEDGLQCYHSWVPRIYAALMPGGHWITEIGSRQRNRVVDIGEASGFRFVSCIQDLAGLDRVLIFEKI